MQSSAREGWFGLDYVEGVGFGTWSNCGGPGMPSVFPGGPEASDHHERLTLWNLITGKVTPRSLFWRAAGQLMDNPTAQGLDTFVESAPASAAMGAKALVGADVGPEMRAFGMTLAQQRVYLTTATGTRIVVSLTGGGALGQKMAHSGGYMYWASGGASGLAPLTQATLPTLMATGTAAIGESFVMAITSEPDPGPTFAPTPQFIRIRMHPSGDPLEALGLFNAGLTVAAPGGGSPASLISVRGKNGILYDNPVGYAAGRSAEIQALAGTHGKPTFAVGVFEIIPGLRVGGITSSNAKGYISPSQLESISFKKAATGNVMEILVGGPIGKQNKRHAEVNLADEASEFGYRFVSWGAGNYVCLDCEQNLEIRFPAAETGTTTYLDQITEMYRLRGLSGDLGEKLEQ